MRIFVRERRSLCNLSYPGVRASSVCTWFLLFAFVVIRDLSFYYRLFRTLPRGRPLPAVGIITGITARIIGDYIINEIFLAPVCKLMRLPWPEKERVARAHFRDSVLVPNPAAART